MRKKFQAFFDNYFAMVERTGANLLGSQPTQGNIRGGLSTIEEKALAPSPESKPAAEPGATPVGVKDFVIVGRASTVKVALAAGAVPALPGVMVPVELR